jgi:hypothetical protein
LAQQDQGARCAQRAALETPLRDCKKVGGTACCRAAAFAVDLYDVAWSADRGGKKVLPSPPAQQVLFENVERFPARLRPRRYLDAREARGSGWHFDIGNVVSFGQPEQDRDPASASRARREGASHASAATTRAGKGRGRSGGRLRWPAVKALIAQLAAEVGGATPRAWPTPRRMDTCSR